MLSVAFYTYAGVVLLSAIMLDAIVHWCVVEPFIYYPVAKPGVDLIKLFRSKIYLLSSVS
jgi:hypothetical protein